MKEEPKRRVGIWIRVSTEDQVRGESPEHHEKRARLYAEAKDWEIVTVYRLNAVSGKTVKDTPEAKRMMVDVREGRINGLIFSKLARLARNTKELLDFAEFFRENQAELISLGESIDTSTPAGRLFYTMIAAMATWERDEIAARVAASVPIRARLGKSTGGSSPYGYAWVDGKMVINEKEAPVRKLMYDLYLEHQRLKTVSRILNERGFRTRKGAPFSDTTVHRLLADPIGKGVRRANHTRSLGDKTYWEPKPEDEWVTFPVEPIISEELWNRVTATLEALKGKSRQKSKRVTHLFSGVTVCECGEKMYVPSNSPKYTCRGCNNKIPTGDLEAVFHEQIKNFFFSPEEIAKHLGAATSAIQEKEILLAGVERDLKKVSTEIDKLYDLYQSGAIDKAGFKAKYHDVAARKAQLEDEFPTLQAEVDTLKIAQLSQEEIIGGAKDLYARWPTLAHEEMSESPTVMRCVIASTILLFSS